MPEEASCCQGYLNMLRGLRNSEINSSSLYFSLIFSEKMMADFFFLITIIIIKISSNECSIVRRKKTKTTWYRITFH